MNDEEEIWTFVQRHLGAIFGGDWGTYRATTADNLSLYEYWIIPHRQDGLEFHQFMIENQWAGEAQTQRFDLFEKRCQQYGDTAIVTYTFMLTQVQTEGVRHRYHNETRVLIKRDGEWKVVHVHKSPATWVARE